MLVRSKSLLGAGFIGLLAVAGGASAAQFVVVVPPDSASSGPPVSTVNIMLETTGPVAGQLLRFGGSPLAIPSCSGSAPCQSAPVIIDGDAYTLTASSNNV